jgi:serine/threonine protein kinase
MRSLNLDAQPTEHQQGKAPISSPNYREEAEKIVADERAQSEKMPVYEASLHSRFEIRANLQGLEGFRLIEKMGDGAFSNVYKAVERKTGRKVAVKVVRKYELNHTQVSILFHYHLLSCVYIPMSILPRIASSALARLGPRRYGVHIHCIPFFFAFLFIRLGMDL